MILDSKACFDPAASAITVTRASTNIIDLLNAGDYGIAGEDHPLKVSVFGDGLFAAAGAAALDIAVQGAPDNGSGAPGTYSTYATLNTLTLAELANKMLWLIDLPTRRIGAAFPRFLRLYYTVATGPMTAGSVQAYLNLGVDDAPAYPSGFSTTYI